MVTLDHVKVSSLNILHLLSAMLSGLNLLLVSSHVFGFMLNSRIIKGTGPLGFSLILCRLLFTLAFTEVLLIDNLSAIETVGPRLTREDAFGGVG
jgi:hypothetical protein